GVGEDGGLGGQVRGLGGAGPAVEIGRGGDNVAHVGAELARDDARALELAESQSDVDVLRHQIEQLVGDEQVEPNAGVAAQESREKAEKSGISEDYRNGDAQHALGLALSSRQHALS